MKGLVRKIAAAAAAFVMSVSAFGATVSAGYVQEALVDSWVMTENGWIFVMPDGTTAKDRLLKIDGVMYEFNSNWAHLYEKYSGWTKNSEGIRRRYVNGLPYTGWLKYKSGQRRYCLDGYMATDNMQIGDHLYTFDENGYYTGKTALTLITKCDKIVSSDSDEIKVALKNLDGRDYNFGVLSKMERWENGEWVNCWGDWKGENGEELAFYAIGYSLENKGDMMELDFNPQLYTNYNFTEGYYRIPIGSWIKQYKNQYECYATFQVVSPVTVRTSSEIYTSDGESEVLVTAFLNFNSSELAEKGAMVNVYKMTHNGWTIVDDGEEAYDFCHEIAIGQESMVCNLDITEGQGYYKAVVTIDDEEYESYFRIAKLVVSPWNDEYSKKTENLTVCFNIFNPTDKDRLTAGVNTYYLYRENNGKWEQVKPDYKINAESILRTVKSKQSITAYAYISEAYDVSRLETGEYAVYIDGCGYVPFILNNYGISEKRYPFAELNADDLDKVEVSTRIGLSTHIRRSQRKEDKTDIAAILSQLEIIGETDGVPDADGASDTIKLYYKNGEICEFSIFCNVIKLNGKYYEIGVEEAEYEIDALAERMEFLADEMPYDDLAAEDIEKIKITESYALKNTAYTTKKADKIKELVGGLNQLKVIAQIEDELDSEGGSSLIVEIFFKDGSTDNLIFTGTKDVVFYADYNSNVRMRVSCTSDAYYTIKKVFSEAVGNK